MCPRCNELKPSFIDYLEKGYLLEKREIPCKYCNRLYRPKYPKSVKIFKTVRIILFLVVTYFTSILLRVYVFENYEAHIQVVLFFLTGITNYVLLFFCIGSIGAYVLWKCSEFEIEGKGSEK